jgi:hypothetical protein
MSEINKLRERHKWEIERLQEECPHPTSTGWLEEYWAPGHSTGRQVKVCNDCGKVVDRTP